MNDCTRYHDLLDAHVDGDLGDRDRAAIEDHLKTCPACSEALEDLRTLVHQAGSLPSSVPPTHDLWPGIAGNLDQGQPRRPARRWVAAAAAVLIAVAAGWLAGRWTAPGPASTQDGPATRTGVRAVANDGDFRSDYRRARAELMGVLDARRSEISPEAMASIQHNIDLIDRAIADIEAALAEYPDDPNLNRSLRLAYDRQLEVLHTATRWTLQS